MKHIIALILFSSLAFSSTAQVDTRRKIEVNGYAEREITPDILYINLSLREYFKDSGNKDKVSISILEKQFYEAASKAGINTSDITTDNISAYNFPVDDKKKKDPGFLASKQYRIKVSNLNGFNKLIESLDSKGIQSTRIDGYDYSQMSSLKNELRIEAVRQAKDKASVLAEAIGDQLGKVIEINDNNSDAGSINFPQSMKSMGRAAYAAESDAMNEPEIDFRSVKINYQIRALFELQ